MEIPLVLPRSTMQKCHRKTHTGNLLDSLIMEWPMSVLVVIHVVFLFFMLRLYPWALRDVFMPWATTIP